MISPSGQQQTHTNWTRKDCFTYWGRIAARRHGGMRQNRQLALINQLDTDSFGGILTPEIRKIPVHLGVSPHIPECPTRKLFPIVLRCPFPRQGPLRANVSSVPTRLRRSQSQCQKDPARRQRRRRLVPADSSRNSAHRLHSPPRTCPPTCSTPCT
jgi:hypothetical protein